MHELGFGWSGSVLGWTHACAHLSVTFEQPKHVRDHCLREAWRRVKWGEWINSKCIDAREAREEG
eukprot:14149012-Alexandrium_andersonii.AAC.1